MRVRAIVLHAALVALALALLLAAARRRSAHR
jgi:hypothetical protein